MTGVGERNYISGGSRGNLIDLEVGTSNGGNNETAIGGIKSNGDIAAIGVIGVGLLQGGGDSVIGTTSKDTPEVSRAVQLEKSVRMIWSTASMVMSVVAPVVWRVSPAPSTVRVPVEVRVWLPMNCRSSSMPMTVSVEEVRVGTVLVSRSMVKAPLLV